MNKSKFYFIIVIFSVFLIISGFFEIIRSLPLFILYQNVSMGGVSMLGVADAESNSVYIVEVKPSSPAAEARLSAGDIIVSVNNINISKTNDYIDFLHKNEGSPFDLVVKKKEGELKQVRLVPKSSKEEATGVLSVI